MSLIDEALKRAELEAARRELAAHTDVTALVGDVADERSVAIREKNAPDNENIAPALSNLGAVAIMPLASPIGSGCRARRSRR